MKVMEYMNTHVTTVLPTATLRDVVDKMDLYQVDTLPVVDEEGNLVGIVSEYDVAAILLPTKGSQTPSVSLAELSRLAREKIGWQVAQVMIPQVVTVEVQEDLAAALQTMLEHRLKCLPVTDHGKLVGLITRIDLCQAILDLETEVV